ncbi:MAG: RNA methyltransferase [Oscillospiraceae bacterium]|nr:RNA methyltransferase [Oscillospiraceae bacterium]
MRENVRITAKDNPAIKHYRRLRDQKKARRAEGLFVIEGLRIVCDALAEASRVQQIFVTDSAWEKHGDTLTTLMQETGSLLRISDAVGSVMTDTEHTQGIFAICRIPERRTLAEALKSSGKYLVLCNLQDPGNMGMILRTADALGVDAILSCGSCELYSPKVMRATMGSIFRVPVYEQTDALALLELLRAQKIRSYAAVPAKHAVKLTECELSGGTAVWIGNEGNGLPADVIAACDTAVTIPMQGGPESLNAAMAAGILMWEMMKSGVQR